MELTGQSDNRQGGRSCSCSCGHKLPFVECHPGLPLISATSQQANIGYDQFQHPQIISLSWKANYKL